MKHKKKDVVVETVSLYSLAQQALNITGGMVNPACDLLLEQITNDETLLRGIISQVLQIASQQTVYRQNGNKRFQVMKAATAAGKGAVIALGKGVSASFLDMPLGDGTLLRNATREQIIEQADRYKNLSDNMGHKSRWLKLLADRVPPNAVCGDVIDDDTAAKLFEKTQ